MKFICLTLSEKQQKKVIIVYALEQEDNKELAGLPLIYLLVQEEMETYEKLLATFISNIA